MTKAFTHAPRRLLMTTGASLLAAVTPLPASTQASWEAKRELSNFQNLLKHSPFSLPTAEESSPLSERYAMTGIVTIGGNEQVFVFDRTDQSRELLSHEPNAKHMSLVALVRERTSSPQKVTIRVGNETGTIGYLEAAPQQAQGQQPRPGSPSGGVPGQPRPGVQLPALPTLPQQPVAGPAAPGQPSNQTPPARRIIRRPIIAPQQTQPNTPSAPAP
jgi:hypothetical protein